VTPSAERILAELRDRLIATQADLRRYTGHDSATVVRALDELRLLGLAELTSHGKRSPLWKIASAQPAVEGVFKPPPPRGPDSEGTDDPGSLKAHGPQNAAAYAQFTHDLDDWEETYGDAAFRLSAPNYISALAHLAKLQVQAAFADAELDLPDLEQFGPGECDDPLHRGDRDVPNREQLGELTACRTCVIRRQKVEANKNAAPYAPSEASWTLAPPPPIPLPTAAEREAALDALIVKQAERRAA
jgi:hypothetical protein